jgi:hypothetical protein
VEQLPQGVHSVKRQFLSTGEVKIPSGKSPTENLEYVKKYDLI